MLVPQVLDGVDRPGRRPRPPRLRFSLVEEVTHQAPPLLGEHATEVLEELGYGPQEVANLRANFVV